MASLIRPISGDRLFFIPAGPTPPNPAELVGSARMRDALEELRDEYDFVILDSPPVLPVTDAVVLGREVDGAVLVVKGHDTPRELLRRARDQLLQANVHLLGAVVNNVDLRWGDQYFYGRYYGSYYAAERVGADRRGFGMRTRSRLDRNVLFTVQGLVLGLPLFLGGRQVIAVFVSTLVVLALLALTLRERSRRSASARTGLGALIAFVGLALLTTLPLPPVLLRLLSPATAELTRACYQAGRAAGAEYGARSHSTRSASGWSSAACRSPSARSLS